MHQDLDVIQLHIDDVAVVVQQWVYFYRWMHWQQQHIKGAVRMYDNQSHKHYGNVRNMDS